MSEHCIHFSDGETEVKTYKGAQNMGGMQYEVPPLSSKKVSVGSGQLWKVPGSFASIWQEGKYSSVCL